MVVFLGEPPVRFLCCCCSFLIFILLLYLDLSMFLILLLFLLIAFDVIPHPSVDYRWSFYTPFYTFSPPHRRVIRDTFIFSAIPFLPGRYSFEWVFFTHRRCLPCALLPTF